MIVFYTSATAHLAPLLPFERGEYICKKFTDGELYIKLETAVTNKKVWVIAATNPPADHLIELFLLLDVLTRNKAKIHLLITYLGYTRQDNPLPAEASAAQLICSILNLFALQKIVIIHAHSTRLHDFLTFENVIPVELICNVAQHYNAIAAPDQGAADNVQHIGSVCNLETVFLTKIRPEQEIVKILEYNGIVRSKKILIIDDIIATGNTVIEVAKILEKLGATHVSAWATHGVFSGNAIESLEKSSIKKVYVTNTLGQHKSSAKIEVITIAPLVEKIIKKHAGI